MTRNSQRNIATPFWPVAAAALMLCAMSAAAQSGPKPEKTNGPANWEEQWSGNYEGQDQPGTQAPPGMKVTNPFSILDDVVTPLLQPWAKERMDATNFDVEESGQVCRSTGIMMAAQNRPFQLVVSPGRITTLGGGGVHTAGIRRIYLDRGHLKMPPLTSLGDSIGRWEGDTLVVDTIGFDDKSFLSLAGTRHSTELHVVERWMFIANGTYLLKEWTVDDPRALKAPYKFTRFHKKLSTDARPNEGTCLSTPANWRAWVQVRNDAIRYESETRAKAAKEMKAVSQNTRQ